MSTNKTAATRGPEGPKPERIHRFEQDSEGTDDCALCGEGILARVHRLPMVGPREPVEPIIVTLAGGSKVEIIESEGWLYIRALDGVLTVRPLNEREIYIRPVGRSGGWIPSVHPARGLEIQDYFSCPKCKAKSDKQHQQPKNPYEESLGQFGTDVYVCGECGHRWEYTR